MKQRKKRILNYRELIEALFDLFLALYTVKYFVKFIRLFSLESNFSALLVVGTSAIFYFVPMYLSRLFKHLVRMFFSNKKSSKDGKLTDNYESCYWKMNPFDHKR